MSKTDLLPRIESTGSGGIVLMMDDGAFDLLSERETSNGLPEYLEDVLFANANYVTTTDVLLRLIAEYAAAQYNRGFLEGRKAEREDWQKGRAGE